MAIVISLNEYEAGGVVPLGRQREDDVRVIKYDLSALIEEFGDGEFSYAYERPDKALYLPSNIVRIDNEACWILTETDTALAGNGRVELRFYPNASTGEVSDLYKTQIFPTNVIPSLTADGPVPHPYEEYLEELRTVREQNEYIKNYLDNPEVWTFTLLDGTEITKQVVIKPEEEVSLLTMMSPRIMSSPEDFYIQKVRSGEMTINDVPSEYRAVVNIKLSMEG